MKKFRYCTFVLAMVFIVVPASAQFSIGVVAVGNFSNLSYEIPGESTDIDTESKAGFGIGLVADYLIGQNMGISVQPTYLSAGATITDSEESVEVNLTYIDIPILFRYMIGSGDTRPYVEVGPAIGLLSKAEFKDDDGTEDIKDETKGTNMSVVFGAGVDVPMGNNTIFAGARYALGTTDISDTDGIEVKTSAIQVVVGFKFKLGGN